MAEVVVVAVARRYDGVSEVDCCAVFVTRLECWMRPNASIRWVAAVASCSSLEIVKAKSQMIAASRSIDRATRHSMIAQ